MYIDNEDLNLPQSDSESGHIVSSREASSQNTLAENVSNQVPSSQEPSSQNIVTEHTSGSMPIASETPSWGPPSESAGSPPVFVIPGQPISPSRPSSRSASIRFLHAAPNQPAVNIRLGNRNVINSMHFGNSTPYYLDSGDQSTLVTVTNASTGDILYQRFFNFSSQTAYTVAIAYRDSSIVLYSLVDTPCENKNGGCLRAVNLSPNSGSVDVFLSGYGRIFQGVTQFSYTGYRSVNQGTYQASVSEALRCTNNNSIIMAERYVECNNTRIAIMDTSTFNIMNSTACALYIIGLAYQFPSLQILPLESNLIYY